MSELNWKIDALTVLPDTDHAVYKICFTVTKDGVNDQGQARKALWNSYVQLDPAKIDPLNFIAFDALDEATLVRWVKAELGDRRLGIIQDMMDYSLKHKLIEDRAIDASLPWEKAA